MTNINLRKLSDGSYFLAYQQNGKAFDASFPNLPTFIDWLVSTLD